LERSDEDAASLLCPEVNAVKDSELFGKRLRQIRESVGLKQVQLARALDVDSKHVSRLERGKVNPSFEIIFRIARTLKASPSLFLEVRDTERDTKAIKMEIQRLLGLLDGEQLRLAHRVFKALFEP
jgi:transcriptional regulator with XRE-family HTH domain